MKMIFYIFIYAKRQAFEYKACLFLSPDNDLQGFMHVLYGLFYYRRLPQSMQVAVFVDFNFAGFRHYKGCHGFLAW